MIFVDSGAWIALLDPSDQHHNEANKIYQKLANRHRYFLTTDYVLDETMTRLRYDNGYRSAIKFLELVNRSVNSGALEVLQINPALFQISISIFQKYPTPKLSFTDCTSFAVCETQNISQVFAFDQHFAMMGFALCTAS